MRIVRPYLESGGVDYRYTPFRKSVGQRLYPVSSRDSTEPSSLADPVRDLLPLQHLRTEIDDAWQIQQPRDPITTQVDSAALIQFRNRITRQIPAREFFYGSVSYQLHQQVPVFHQHRHGRRELELTDYLLSSARLDESNHNAPPILILTAASGFGKTVSLWKAFFDCLCVRQSRLEAGSPALLAGMLPVWIDSEIITRRLRERRDLRERNQKRDNHNADDLLEQTESLLRELLATISQLPDKAGVDLRPGHLTARWRHWLVDGPPLILFCDLNHLSQPDQLELTEALIELHRIYGDRLRIVTAYRSQTPETDQVLAAFQGAAAHALDLEPLEPRFAASYLRHFREYEAAVWARFADCGLTPPVRNPDEEVQLLQRLIARTVRRVRRSRPGTEASAQPEFEESLVSVPLLMHWVSLLRGERLQTVKTIADLYLAVLKRHHERERASSSLDDKAWKHTLVGMVRVALVLLHQSGRTRLTLDEATAALRYPEDDTRWWLAQFFHQDSQYHGPTALRCSEHEAEAVLRHGLFRRDGETLGFAHDSLIYALAGIFALRQYRSPNSPLLVDDMQPGEYRAVSSPAWPQAVAALWASAPQKWRLVVPFLAGVLADENWQDLFVQVVSEQPHGHLVEIVREFCRGAVGRVPIAKWLDREKFHRVGCRSEETPDALASELHATLFSSTHPNGHPLAERLAKLLHERRRSWLRLGTGYRPETCQIMSRHKSPVLCVATWQDPNDASRVRVVSGDESGMILVWDPSRPPDDPEAVTVLKGNKNAVTFLCVLPDGRIVSGADDTRLLVWDPSEPIESPERVTILNGHKRKVTCVCAIPTEGVSGCHIVSGSADGTLRVWNLTKPIRSRKRVTIYREHTGPVRCVSVLSGDGPHTCRIVSGSDDTTLRIWFLTKQMDSVKRINVLNGHTGAVICLTTLKDGRIVSGSIDKTVRVWGSTKPDTAQTHVVALEGHRNHVIRVTHLRDGRVVSSDNGATVRIWDLTKSEGDAERAITLNSDTVFVEFMALLNDGRIAVSGYDGTLRVWDLMKREHDSSRFTILQGHSASITCLNHLSDGRMVSGSDDTTVRVWEPIDLDDSTRSITTSDGRPRGVKYARIQADARTLTVGADGALRVWDLTKQQGHPERVRTIEEAGKDVECFAALADGRLVSGCRDGRIRLIDLSHPVGSSERVMALKGTSLGRVRCLSVFPDGRMVAACYSHSVRVFDLAQFEEDARTVMKLDDDKTWHWSIMSLPGGRIVLSDHFNPVQLWDCTTYDHSTNQITNLTDGKCWVDSVAEYFDGRVLAGAADKTVRVWDLESGKSEIWLSEVHPVSLAVNRTGAIAIATPRNVLWYPRVFHPGPPLIFSCERPVSAIAMHPTEPWFVVGCETGELLQMFVESPEHPPQPLLE